MPTNDERREIAARLRRACQHTFYSYEQLVDVLRGIIGTGNHGDHAHLMTLRRLADLIEPEERTCRIDRRVPDAPFCSECSYDWNDDWSFCPNCGRRVKEAE